MDLVGRGEVRLVDVFAEGLEAQTVGGQDGSRHGRFLAEEAQEQMLGTDVVVM
jgi:hypothetical protein